MASPLLAYLIDQNIFYKMNIAMARIGFIILSIILPFTIFAQVSTISALTIDTRAVTITFDASQGTAGLKDYTGDIYAHTGIITANSTSSTDWKYTLANWTTNIPKAKMTRVAPNTYTLEIAPDIRSFYAVPGSEIIKQMAFVFRSADQSKEGKDTGGKDILVNVYNQGLNVNITSPSKINVFDKTCTFSFQLQRPLFLILSYT